MGSFVSSQAAEERAAWWPEERQLGWEEAARPVEVGSGVRMPHEAVLYSMVPARSWYWEWQSLVRPAATASSMLHSCKLGLAASMALVVAELEEPGSPYSPVEAVKRFPATESAAWEDLVLHLLIQLRTLSRRAERPHRPVCRSTSPVHLHRACSWREEIVAARSAAWSWSGSDIERVPFRYPE